MVVDEFEVDRLFAALADRTRRDIVRQVLQGEASVSALAARYEMSFAAVQKHVAVLERAGLVTKEVAGRTRLVSAEMERVRAVGRLLEEYEELWRGRIGRLDELLDETDEGDGR